MPKKSFKIPFGMKDGRPTHISEVVSGLKCDCSCPDCEGQLIARKGKIKEHHFAHQTDNPNCNPESIIHKTAKAILMDRIETALRENKDLNVKSKCEVCRKENTENILSGAVSVELEKSLDNCRPDLVLLDVDGKPLVLVEVVVTSPPKENVIEYVNGRKLGLVEFHLKTVEELEPLRKSKVLMATKVSPCIPCKSVSKKAPLKSDNYKDDGESSVSNKAPLKTDNYEDDGESIELPKGCIWVMGIFGLVGILWYIYQSIKSSEWFSFILNLIMNKSKKPKGKRGPYKKRYRKSRYGKY